MKKRWFVVILTIGLLLHVLPLSVLALSPDPTITDSDGTLLVGVTFPPSPTPLMIRRNRNLLFPTFRRRARRKALRTRAAIKQQRMTCPQGIPPPKLLTRDGGR